MSSKFVPSCDLPIYSKIEKLGSFIKSCKKLLVLTGAGISTESGIPDYRSEGVGLYARKVGGPMQYQTFLKSKENRQRYWARNFVGWPWFSSILPNDVHKILVKWERQKRILHTITQNVDNLHIKAGSKKLVELHGNSHHVLCVNCHYRISRHDFQQILQYLNPNFFLEINHNSLNPDGDVLLPDELIQSFQFPNCTHCNGLLKPDVVFFGDNVPKFRKQFVSDLVNICDGLLCLGTSLQVFSSFRIVNEAYELGKPIGIVNIGSTRGDSFTKLKLEARLGYLFPKVDDIISKM